MGNAQRKTEWQQEKQPSLKEATDRVLHSEKACEELAESTAKVLVKKQMEAFLNGGNLNKEIEKIAVDDASIHQIFSDLDDEAKDVLPTHPAFSKKAFFKQLSKNPSFIEGIKNALYQEIEEFND